MFECLYCIQATGIFEQAHSVEGEDKREPLKDTLPVYYYWLSSIRVCSGHTAAPATPLGRLRSWRAAHPGKNPDVCSESRSVPIAAIRLPPGSTAVTHGTGSNP